MDRLIGKHPLQRLHSPSRGVSAFVHSLGLLSFSLSFKYLVDWPNPVNDSYGWHMQYLTIIGLSLATATFIVGLLADAFQSPRLFLIKNNLAVASAPLEVLISLLYWSIRSIDKNLVMPEWVKLDLRADLGFHAVPAIMLVVDLLLLSPPWTISALPSIGVSGVLAFSYWLWVEQCYKHNGWYPYPLFEALSQPWRLVLFTFSALVMALSTATLKWLYGRVNGFGTSSDPHAKPGDVKKA
ncbi:integral membrane protein [Xylona heveae TC161]|uniref:Integral membrane protein n=1 Tax=Xylona heveae (strain CBS 132557 / TC161) TaxID=1328760 RepID=A0A165JZP5_XYLHT|nr:integral membrane protein [Xylona heveae TC161]KZF26827.1 integral membrane protein [Xylona heveae TC161]